MKQPKPPRGLPCGKWAFKAQRVTTTHLAFVAETTCMLCGEPLSVVFGEMFATFRIGNEFVGIACDDCLDERSRQRVRTLRGQQAVTW